MRRGAVTFLGNARFTSPRFISARTSAALTEPPSGQMLPLRWAERPLRPPATRFVGSSRFAIHVGKCQRGIKPVPTTRGSGPSGSDGSTGIYGHCQSSWQPEFVPSQQELTHRPVREAAQALALIFAAADRLEIGVLRWSAVSRSAKVLPEARDSRRDLRTSKHRALDSSIDGRTGTFTECTQRPDEIIAVLRFVSFIQRESL